MARGQKNECFFNFSEIRERCVENFCFIFYRPDGVNTVTVDEKERFEEIKDRLRAYLSNQITHFR